MDERLYQMAISKPLDEKIKKAITLIQHYEKTALSWDMFEPWYHVCNSYGKDSTVLRRLVQMAAVSFKCYHNLTTLDPPELILFGRENHPETIINKPPRALLSQWIAAEGQGPPTRLARWCCEIYKERGCQGQIKVFGVRAEESQRRKINWKQWQPALGGDGWILNPILYWTEDDVWTFIRQHNLPYCSLHDEGFKRLGCIGCPMAGKGRLKEFARWPKYEAAWKRAFQRFWAKWHGVPLLRPRWVSMEGKYPFAPLPGEREETRWVSKTERMERGFWTLRRWYDLRGFQTWQDMWHWWMQDEEEPEGCAMGQW